MLGFALRFDGRSGKEFRPLCLFENGAGVREWRWESWPELRPLYGLDRLAASTDAPLVLVCEGEKAADAAQALSGLPALTSPAGSKSAAKANWQPLSGRDVVIWPDADEPGAKYAETVAKLLKVAGAKSVRLIAPPASAGVGWDAADALAAGWTGEQVEQMIASAGPVEGKAGARATSGAQAEPRRGRQRDDLMAAADSAVLWHSPQKVAFATVPVNHHFEHYALTSSAFSRWLAGRYYEATGNAPAGQMLADAKRVLEVRAIENGPRHKPAMRVAWQDGASWLDLCDDRWRAVRIDGAGWSIVEQPPVKFVRTETMDSLPDPEPGFMLEELRPFVNAEDDDYKLIVAWLVASLWARDEIYPVLALGGEQGSGKSTIARLLQSLCDPSAVRGLALPRDDRDLFTMAMSGHALSFDNVSKIEAWFSDAICRLATGAGYLTRKLHSDAEPFWFQGSRPVILNGIPTLTDRADLAERAVAVRLLRIDRSTRKSEQDWRRDWAIAQPRILGALLDALSAAVRRYDHVTLTDAPRLADFAKLMVSCEAALGWEPGDFLRAYDDNQRATTDAVFESDPVAVAIHRLMGQHAYEGSWEGTATALLDQLNIITPEDVRRSKFWPVRVNALGNAVDRASPLLRHKGINVRKRSTGTARLIILTMLPL